LKSKDEDPGIIVVDDAAQFVIPVLSGHVGGANACSEMLADLLGATVVSKLCNLISAMFSDGNESYFRCGHNATGL
jgi:hypothetical protein